MHRLYEKIRLKILKLRKKVDSSKAEHKKTVFDSRKRTYNAQVHYLVDVEYPSRLQRFCMISGHPFWFNLILALTYIDAMLYMHAAIVSRRRLITDNFQYQLMLEIFVSVFKLMDIALQVSVAYVLKLEFHSETRRPAWVLLCEMFGAVPLYPPVPQWIVLAGHASKFVRVAYHFYALRVSLHCDVRHRALNFVLTLVMCETVYAWIFFHLSGATPSWETYMQAFEVASAALLGKGGVVSKSHHYADSVWLHEMPLTCGIILVLFIVIKPTLCDLICLLTMQYESKFKYVYKVYLFESTLARKYECTPAVVTAILLYLRNFWAERAGCVRTPERVASLELIFPRSLLMEMSLDACYDAFRHSKLLRTLEIPVMRNLALRFRNQLLMKGEFIYNKRGLVDYLVYVASGTVDVLSIENGDSGVLSLSDGTCLGETALFYPFHAKVNVRCQTICHVFILHRNEFMTIITRMFPFVYEGLLQVVHNRIAIAKRLQNAKEANQVWYTHQEQIVWLKAKLHQYASSNATVRETHLLRNVYLQPLLTSLLRKHKPLLHTVRNLDLLMIKPREDVKQDLVFIRSKCIWIMKHDSPITKAWDIFIVLLAIVILVLQPYVTFNETSPVLVIIIIVIYIFFVLDLLLSLITPISPKSRATTLSEIFAERFRSYGLYLDICAIFYFPMFGHVFPFAHEKWMFLFHTVKLWKLYRLMYKWGNRFKLNLLLQKYCLFVFSQFIYVFTLGYLLLLADIIPDALDPVGFQISTGVGFKIKSGALNMTILYAFVNTIAAVFEGLGIVSVTTANYMKYIRTGRIYLSLKRLYALNKRQPHSQLFRRLNSLLNTQINDNNAFMCAFNIVRFFDFPDQYSELMKTSLYMKALADLEFFHLAPKNVVKRLSCYGMVNIFHRHSLILSYGSKFDAIYIIVHGEARTVRGDQVFVTRNFTPINLLEAVYDYPCSASVVAITEVEVVSFSYKKFLTLLGHHHNQIIALNAALERTRVAVTAYFDKITKGKQVIIKTLQQQDQESFVKFDLKNVFEDSYEEFDYYVPFDKSSCRFVRYFLLKRTIQPTGKFLFIWEVVRCICAYITCLVFFIPPISLRPLTHVCTYCLIALDLTALIDIYVRLHVCYYNSEGLLIAHPLYTAKNYLRKAFFIDFIACFPLYLFVHNSPQYRILGNGMHLLQLYRMVGFKFHYFCTSYVFDYIFILVSIVWPVNLISCVIFMADCYDWEHEGDIEINCKNFKLESPIGNFITITYFIMSTMTCSGTGSVVDLEHVTPMILNMISFCSFASTFVRIYVTAYLFGSYNKIYSGRHKMRDKVRRLVIFLRMEKVRPYLRKQFKIYYELKWRWLRRINPFYLLRNLNPSLRRDLTYCLFGEHMHKFSKLQDTNNDLGIFYKNILFDAKPLIIPKNGYILTVNDVNAYIYMIHKGSVDVVAANGSVIDTIYDGAFLGNLDPIPYYRQRVSFVTNTVTKLFYLKANDFHNVLSQHPLIKTSFYALKYQNFSYISSKYVENEYQKAQWSWTKRQLKVGYAKYQFYFILSWFHFIFPCCIGLTMELYQIATGEMHIAYLSVQYVFDAIHLLHQYLKFKTPFMTQQQEFVMHPLRIKAHSMGRKRLYFKLYFLNLPFDVPFLLALWLMRIPFVSQSIIFSCLRINRLSRWVNITQVYYIGTKKVASFSRLFKVFMLLLLLIYSSLLIATIIALADYLHTYYMGAKESHIIREMPVEILLNLREGPWTERAQLYGRYWFFSLLVHTFSHDNLYYPVGELFEGLFVVIFLYVIVFESFVMVQYYEVLMESTTLVKIVYIVKEYVNVYYNLSKSSHGLQANVYEAITHYYAIKSVADDYLMVADSPRYLREAAMLSIYGYLFRSQSFLLECHTDFLRQISGHMRCVYYPINSTIASRFDCHDTLYFVHKGEVAAMQYENDCTYNALYLFCKGDSFGYQQSFNKKPYQYTYRAITFCEILELEWHKCEYLMDFFPMSMAHIGTIMETNLTHCIKPTEEVVSRKRRL